MGSKKNGLLALLGLGAIAYWKYKKSTPEEKQLVKDKIATAKENLCKFGNDLKVKAEETMNQAKDKAEELQRTVEDSVKK